MNIAEQTRFKIMLLAHKEELLELEQSIQADQSSPSAAPGQQMAQETPSRRSQELEKVEAALNRISSGRYGYCVDCGGDIDVRRLEINPAVAQCGNCNK